MCEMGAAMMVVTQRWKMHPEAKVQDLHEEIKRTHLRGIRMVAVTNQGILVGTGEQRKSCFSEFDVMLCVLVTMSTVIMRISAWVLDLKCLLGKNVACFQ